MGENQSHERKTPPASNKGKRNTAREKRANGLLMALDSGKSACSKKLTEDKRGGEVVFQNPNKYGRIIRKKNWTGPPKGRAHSEKKKGAGPSRQGDVPKVREMGSAGSR